MGNAYVVEYMNIIMTGCFMCVFRSYCARVIEVDQERRLNPDVDIIFGIV